MNFNIWLDAQALGWGFLFGHDEGFSKELRTTARAAGVSHLTAASGANIGLFQSILAPLQFWFWPHVFLCMVMVGVYWNLSGASGSLWRASFMALWQSVSLAMGRPIHIWWMVFWVGILAIFSYWRDSLGFWLSWIAVYGVYISQNFYSSEKESPYFPHTSKIYNSLHNMLVSGVIILIFVSVPIYFVFGEWQPNGVYGTLLSQPLVPLYMCLFALFLFFKESNLVALKDVTERIITLFFMIFVSIWKSVAAWPLLVGIITLILILCTCLFSQLKKIVDRRGRYREALEWGWES